MPYKNKSEWNLARNNDWLAKRPARQKLTNQVSAKGSKLYCVYVGTDDHNRMKAELRTWSVTSLRKLKKTTHIGIIRKVRDVKLFIVQDGTYGISKDVVSCLGNEGEEVLDGDYFSTPKKTIKNAIKSNLNCLKWSKTRPLSTPETEAMDSMFSAELYERKKLALERLEKRLNK
ncbi:MAG: hypothetical protein V7749_00865 [Cocleimonas sp.]